MPSNFHEIHANSVHHLSEDKKQHFLVIENEVQSKGWKNYKMNKIYVEAKTMPWEHIALIA